MTKSRTCSGLFKRSAGTVVLVCLVILTFPVAGTTQELRTYRVTCDQDEFNAILADPWNNTYIDCEFEFHGETYEDTRIRLRGESSREYPKKSFKINFQPDNPFTGRDKVNLVSGWRDTSYVREYLAYDLYKRAGLLASNAWFARFYVNNNYMGLYLDVEQVDQIWLDSSDVSDNASVYKADRGGCILTSAESLDDLWQKETNLNTGFAELRNLIEILETTPDDLFYERLQSLFDVDELARVIAVNAMLGNSSTYYHNYFMIKETGANGLWHMLPWDMDFTFYFRGSFRFPEYYRSGHEVIGANTLIRRSWLDEEMRAIIFSHFEGMIDSLFTQEFYRDATAELENLLSDAADEDTFKAQTMEQFSAQIRMIPGSVRGRGERLLNQFENDIGPFDLNQVTITPIGAYLSWMRATAGDGSPVTFNVYIGTNRLLSENRLAIRDIEDQYLFIRDIEPGDYYCRVWAFTEDGRYTYSVSPFRAFTIPENGFEGTLVNGSLDSALVLTNENSPYVINEGLVIEAGASLQIEPGVIIGMGSGVDIIVRGELSASGNVNDSISFVPLLPFAPWGEIRIEESDHPCTLSFSTLSGGGMRQGESNGQLISVTGSEIVIQNCRLSSSQLIGVNLTDSDAEITSSVFSRIPRAAISSQDGNLTVRSCQFALSAAEEGENDDVISVLSGRNVTISENIIYSGSDEGISINNVTGQVYIERNRIRYLNDKGISINGASGDLRLENNIVTDCRQGLFIRTGASAEVYNCLFAFNNIGVKVMDSSNVTARNSILWRNGEEINLAPDAEIDIAYSVVRGNEVYPGESNFYRNVHFMDQWNYNFYLSEASPLIDAGWSGGHPELDFNHREREDILGVPNTGSGDVPYVDIGVYEYSILGFSDNNGSQPVSHHLVNIYPNPFNSEVNISIKLGRITPFNLKIYDLTGRLISRWHLDEPRAVYSLNWRGVNLTGKPVGSGVYICVVDDDMTFEIRKMVLVR